ASSPNTHSVAIIDLRTCWRDGPIKSDHRRTRPWDWHGLSEVTSPGGKVRLFVETPLEEGAHVAPSMPQSHYLLHVMRARIGDRVSLFNGRDGEWPATITEATRRDCVFGCERKLREQTHDDDLLLVFAPNKKSPADYLAQRAT